MRNRFLPLNFPSSATSSSISSLPFPSFAMSPLRPRFPPSGPTDSTQSFERFTMQISLNLSIETEHLEFPLFTIRLSATHSNDLFRLVSSSAVLLTSILQLRLPNSPPTPKSPRLWIDKRRIRPLPDSTFNLPFPLLSLLLPLHLKFPSHDLNPVSPLLPRANDSPSLDSLATLEPLLSVTASRTHSSWLPQSLLSLLPKRLSILRSRRISSTRQTVNSPLLRAGTMSLPLSLLLYPMSSLPSPL